MFWGFFYFSEQFYVDTIFAMFFTALGFIWFVFVRFWLLLTSTFGIKKKVSLFLLLFLPFCNKTLFCIQCFFSLMLYIKFHIC